MQTIAVKQLIIATDRQRREFDPQALLELGQTIATKGLMHAIVARETDAGLVLVAGERRVRAIEDMWMLGGELKYNGAIVPEGHIPYVTLGQLSPLEAEEAELEENLHRKDLTWQESAAAMAKLHKIRCNRAQVEGRIHTVADTAMETKGRTDGGYHAAVRKDLIIANHLHNPEVAKAKTADEAYKILKRQEAVAKNIELAVTVGKTFTSAVHEVVNADCLQWMRQAAPAQYDVILTDPPYGMDADQFSDGGNGRLANSEHQYDDSKEAWLALMQEWCPLAFALAKPQCHAYVFCDLDNFHALKLLMQAAGWYVFRTPFIATKPNSGRVPLPDEGPRRQYELVLYAIKGHKKTTAIYSDVIATFGDAGLGHGAQKPVALFEDLLRRSVHPGDSILDTFAGTGTLLVAAHNLQCKATVIEREKNYYGICLQRMQGLDTQPMKDKDRMEIGADLAHELNELLRKEREV